MLTTEKKTAAVKTRLEKYIEDNNTNNEINQQDWQASIKICFKSSTVGNGFALFIFLFVFFWNVDQWGKRIKDFCALKGFIFSKSLARVMQIHPQNSRGYFIGILIVVNILCERQVKEIFENTVKICASWLLTLIGGCIGWARKIGWHRLWYRRHTSSRYIGILQRIWTLITWKKIGKEIINFNIRNKSSF